MGDKYNGWTNYETWAWSLWLDNDEGSYRNVRYIADELAQEKLADLDDAPSLDDATPEQLAAIRNDVVYAIAERIEQEAEEAMPEVEGVWADLLRASFGEIDWQEIAEHLLPDVFTTATTA